MSSYRILSPAPDSPNSRIRRLIADSESQDCAVAVPAIDSLLRIAEKIASPTVRRTLGGRYLVGMDWQDGLQETLWRVAAGLEGCRARTEAEFGAWVRVIAARVTLRMLLRNEREVPTSSLIDTPIALEVSNGCVDLPTSEPHAPTKPLPSASLMSQLRRLGVTRQDAESLLRALPGSLATEKLLWTLTKLADGQRQIVCLRLARGMTWRQIADSLRTTMGAARRRFDRAVVTLQRLVRDDAA